MRIGEALRAAAATLHAAGVETPDLDARVLAREAFDISSARLLADGAAPASAEGLGRLQEFTRRRASGEPVSRILGRREFWGLDFALAPETLTPRPETETLVEAALALVGPPDRAISILDLGTGSGCLLLALLSELPNALGLGVDLSHGAAAAARGNATSLGLEARARFMVGRWAEAIDARFDLVVSNPPYIATAEIEALEREVRIHDPALALDGGPDGLVAYRDIASALPRLLAPGGAAILELGIGQLQDVSRVAHGAGLTVGEARADLARVPRALCLRLAADPACDR